jgi:hypothetical protein
MIVMLKNTAMLVFSERLRDCVSSCPQVPPGQFAAVQIGVFPDTVVYDDRIVNRKADDRSIAAIYELPRGILNTIKVAVTISAS